MTYMYIHSIIVDVHKVITVALISITFFFVTKPSFCRNVYTSQNLQEKNIDLSLRLSYTTQNPTILESLKENVS